MPEETSTSEPSITPSIFTLFVALAIVVPVPVTEAFSLISMLFPSIFTSVPEILPECEISPDALTDTLPAEFIDDVSAVVRLPVFAIILSPFKLEPALIFIAPVLVISSFSPAFTAVFSAMVKPPDESVTFPPPVTPAFTFKSPVPADILTFLSAFTSVFIAAPAEFMLMFAPVIAVFTSKCCP